MRWCGSSASLSGALDGLAGTPLWSMTPEEERTVLVELRRQRARLEELELRLLVQADRDGVGAESGATSTPAWLAHATRTTTTSRHRDLHLARKLDETFTVTRAALAAGLIDVEKARIVAAAVEALTEEFDDLPAGTQEAAEAHLVDQAQAFDAPTLRAAGEAVVRGGLPGGGRRGRGRQAGQGGGQGAGVGALLGPSTTGTAPARAGSSSPPCTRTC